MISAARFAGRRDHVVQNIKTMHGFFPSSAKVTETPSDSASRHFVVEWMLLGCALLVICAVMGYGMFHSYQDIEARERERLINQAQVVDANLSRQLDAVNHVLTLLQADWVEQKTHPSGAERTNRQLLAFVEAMPPLRTLTIHDANGTVVASSEPRLLKRNFRERAYFDTPRKNPSADVLYVSPPFETVLGAYVMTVTRIVAGPQGQFDGVVVATLDPEEFRILMGSVRYAPDVRVGLSHEDGTLVMSATRPEVAGKSVAKPGSFFSRHVASGRKESVFKGSVSLTGEERLIAFATIKPPGPNMDHALIVGVSRLHSELYSAWRAHVYEEIGLLGLLLASTASGLWLLQRRRRGFAQAAALAAKQLAGSERILRTIVDNQPQGVSILAPDGAIERINPAGLAMIEAGHENAVVGSNFADLVAKPHRAAFIDLGRRVNAGASESLTFEVVGHAGGRRWLELQAVPMRDGDGAIIGQLAVMIDVTERRRIQQNLERLSQTDALTGLANRRHFMTLAEQEMSRTLRYGGGLSVLMLDIDHFKSVNDTYGHKVGDTVLKRLAGLCRETLRDVDVVGRIGGEEFAVLLPQTVGERAYEVAERLRATIAKTDVHLEQGLPLHFTASIGVATLNDSGANLDTLLSQADGALYEAKRAGRNRVRVSG